MKSHPPRLIPPFPRWLFLVALSWLAACTTTEKLAPAPRPTANLAGDWVLDPGRSDDPIEAMQAASAIADIEGHHRHSGSHAMRHNRTDASGGGAGDENAADAGGRARKSDDLLGLPEKFTVSQQGGILEMTAQGRGHERYDPAAPTTEVSGAGDSSIRAGWDRDVFVRIRKGPRGMTRTDRFSRPADPAGLLVETILQAPRYHDPVRVRRLYRPA